MQIYHGSLPEPDNIIEISHIKLVIDRISFEGDDKLLGSHFGYLASLDNLIPLIDVLVVAVEAVDVVVLELLPTEAFCRVNEDVAVETEQRSHGLPWSEHFQPFAHSLPEDDIGRYDKSLHLAGLTVYILNLQLFLQFGLKRNGPDLSLTSFGILHGANQFLLQCQSSSFLHKFLVETDNGLDE